MALCAGTYRAEAQNPICPANVVGPSKVSLQWEGHPGAWIHEAVLRCMYLDLEELHILRTRGIETYEMRLDASDQYAAALQQSLLTDGRIQEHLEQQVVKLTTLAREATESRDAWYRSPWLWAAVGGAVVIVLEVVALALAPRGG